MEASQRRQRLLSVVGLYRCNDDIGLPQSFRMRDNIALCGKRRFALDRNAIPGERLGALPPRNQRNVVARASQVAA